jgi:hypothetical protein
MWFKRDKGGTGVDIKVEFEFMGKKHNEEIDLPYEIYVEGFIIFADYKEVTIDGRDNKIWNLLVDLDAIENLERNEDFLNICKELYLSSNYFETDQEEWREEMQDEYEFKTKTGNYKEEEE